MALSSTQKGPPNKKEVVPDDIGDFMEHVSADAKGWLHAQKEYTLLIVSERFGRMSASLMVVILLALLLAGGLFMSSIALGLYLGAQWESWPLGFLCVAGLYILLAVLFFAFGQKPTRNMVTLTIINASRDEDPFS